MKALSICILTIGMICSTDGRLERIHQKPESPLMTTFPQWVLDKPMKHFESGRLEVNFEGELWTGKYSTSIEENKYHCSQGALNFLLYFNSASSLYDAKTEGKVVLKNAAGMKDLDTQSFELIQNVNYLFFINAYFLYLGGSLL